MTFTPKVDQAIRLASHLHRNQIRRDRVQTPYVSHLFAVATILSSVTDDEDTIIAGLMHDSLEDVPGYSYENLISDCGERVAEIVRYVTEPMDANKSEFDQLPWLTRKEMYLDNLRKGGIESALVSAADKIHNTESFIQDMHTEGQEFLAKFHASLVNRVWFHEQVLEIIEEKLGQDNPLAKRLRLCTDEFKKLVTLSLPKEEVLQA